MSGNTDPLHKCLLRVVSVGVQACNGAPEGRRHQIVQVSENADELSWPADQGDTTNVSPQQSFTEPAIRALVALF
jgi:hypothetical protein